MEHWAVLLTWARLACASAVGSCVGCALAPLEWPLAHGCLLTEQ